MQLKCCPDNRFSGLAMGHKACALCPLIIDRLDKKMLNCKPYLFTTMRKTLLKTRKCAGRLSIFRVSNLGVEPCKRVCVGRLVYIT